MRIEEDKYKCEICGKEVKSYSTLFAHQKEIHKIRPSAVKKLNTEQLLILTQNFKAQVPKVRKVPEVKQELKTETKQEVPIVKEEVKVEPKTEVKLEINPEVKKELEVIEVKKEPKKEIKPQVPDKIGWAGYIALIFMSIIVVIVVLISLFRRKPKENKKDKEGGCIGC